MVAFFFAVILFFLAGSEFYGNSDRDVISVEVYYWYIAIIASREQANGIGSYMLRLR